MSLRCHSSSNSNCLTNRASIVINNSSSSSSAANNGSSSGKSSSQAPPLQKLSQTTNLQNLQQQQHTIIKTPAKRDSSLGTFCCVGCLSPFFGHWVPRNKNSSVYRFLSCFFFF